MKLHTSFVIAFLFVSLACPWLHAQSALNRSVRTAENLEPAIPLPEQDKVVAAKLAALEKKTGKKPKKIGL